MSHTLMRSLVIGVAFLAIQSAALAVAQTPTDAVGPLHSRAVEHGGHLREPSGFGVEDSVGTLRELIARSDVAIIGRVLSVKCRPDRDGRRLETTAVVFVQDVVRGSLRLGQLIKVTVPAGVHSFSDGVVVEQMIPHYRLLKADTTYALMLERKGTEVASGYPVFTLAAGPQGQFQLDFEHDAIAPSLLRPSDSIYARYSGMTVAAFLREAHGK